MIVPTETLTRPEQTPAQPPATPSPEEDAYRAAARTHAKRVRRLKINVAAWAVGTIVLTTLWALNQWNANGAFERFGNEGNPGDWSPTLWALGVGIWGLIVGIMALQVHFEKPTMDVKRDDIGRLKFHVAAWALGMIVLTPLWALIEWQDNGSFERWSDNSQPGSWDPWILVVGGIWALAIALLAVGVGVARRYRSRS
jgi:uncharacterized protein YjfI (DUF2170 family)